MNRQDKIEKVLNRFIETDDYKTICKELLNHITGRELVEIDLNFTPEQFIQEYKEDDRKSSALQKVRELFSDNIEKIHVVQQLKEEQIKELLNNSLFNDPDKAGLTNSFLFLIVRMKSVSNRKTTYAKITREINRSFNAPAVILFCSQQEEEHSISLSFIYRRQHKIKNELDVVGKVSMLHNINCKKPHRAHLEIIADLHIPTCLKKVKKDKLNFDGLMDKWLDILDIDELSKKFYKELYTWFEKAINSDKVKFPNNFKVKTIEGTSKTKINEKLISKQEQIIRLITRFMFVWFMKEKKFIPVKLFDESQVDIMLKDFDKAKGDNYYFAILQNLFFGTLNTPIKNEKGKDNRKFSGKSNQGHRVFTSWRYEDMIKDPQVFKSIMNKIPFINGGLFECLDSNEASGDDAGYRLDCFTDNHNQRKNLSIPNHLFFSENGKDGLIDIFNSYKFTVEENTPLDIDVALDPELLGKVFENLLATYNPETQKTARKSSGSYYTPRSVVDYMVTSSLKEYLKNYLAHAQHTAHNLQNNLNDLFNQELEGNPFDPNYTDVIIKAISNIKVLDPAVGSGAFPMEVLRTCVELLQKLDPDNQKWKKQQLKNLPEMQELAKDIKHAEKINYQEAREKAQEKLKERQNKIEDDFNKLDHNYLRKLYLIRKNIYGVDIQPIACQIAKLRFFISLTIEQQPHYEDGEDNNFGIQSLPNLETNFICADTLMNLYKPATEDLYMDEIDDIKTKLQQNRDAFFTSNTRYNKSLLINKDKKIRKNLWEALQKYYEPLMSQQDKMKENPKLKDGAIRIQQTIDKIASWNLMDQITAADWFDAEWMLGEKNGFDLVIGNPPYIRSNNICKIYKKRKELKEYVVHQGSTDIYTYFYEQGLNLLKPSGFLCFITSNKWMRSKYGGKLRILTKNNTSIQQIIDLGGHKIFKAAVDTNIIILSKQKPTSEQQLLYDHYLPSPGLPLKEMKQGDLSDNTFLLESAEMLEIKHKIEKIGTPLNKWNSILIRRGIITGYNKAFIISNQQKKELCRQEAKSIEIIKPILKGEDISTYSYKGAGISAYSYKCNSEWVICTFPSKGININDYPAIKSHLLSFGKDRLSQTGEILSNGEKARKKTNHKWFETTDTIAYYKEFEKEKIIFPDIASQLTATLDTNSMSIIDTCNFMNCQQDNKYITALLNSKLMNVYFSLISAQLGSAAIRHKIIYIKMLPLIKLPADKQKPFNKLVDTILHKKGKGLPTKKEEKKIDDYVYKLYELTTKQKQIVEDRDTEMLTRRSEE